MRIVFGYRVFEMKTTSFGFSLVVHAYDLKQTVPPRVVKYPNKLNEVKFYVLKYICPKCLNVILQ